MGGWVDGWEDLRIDSFGSNLKDAQAEGDFSLGEEGGWVGG